MANFECCHKCHPPKRQPGCHGYCPEYKAERAAYDEKMDVEKSKRRLANALNAETGRQVARATKRRRD
jgi:hypothetical protein